MRMQSLRTIVDGASAIAWLEMGGEKKSQSRDDIAWLRGRLRYGKWVRRTAWTDADGVAATRWLEMGRV